MKLDYLDKSFYVPPSNGNTKPFYRYQRDLKKSDNSIKRIGER